MLVIGAGPAGSAAACVLAAAGRHVLIADQQTFPRDKICGDGLISDALHALTALGVDADVTSEAWRGQELRLYAPNLRHVTLRSDFACLPRERLDDILLTAARRAGADFRRATAVSPLLNGNGVAGARFTTPEGGLEVRAGITILAVGANATVLNAFGLAAPTKPDAVAGRAYYEVTSGNAPAIDHLVIAYDRGWCPGYGWIFPSPGGRFNIGVALFGATAARGRLHRFFDAFCRTFPPAAGLLATSTCIRPFRGAPIRSGLQQLSAGRPGLLAAGEAMATTYSATGEGIGKALESGMLAAEMVDDALRTRRPLAGLADAYRMEFLRRFGARYRAYRVAQRWAGSPMLLNVLATRANAGRYVQAELEALIREQGDASSLFSAGGFLKALVG